MQVKYKDMCENIAFFRRISGFSSKMVQDAALVTMELV